MVKCASRAALSDPDSHSRSASVGLHERLADRYSGAVILPNEENIAVKTRHLGSRRASHDVRNQAGATLRSKDGQIGAACPHMVCSDVADIAIVDIDFELAAYVPGQIDLVQKGLQLERNLGLPISRRTIPSPQRLEPHLVCVQQRDLCCWKEMDRRLKRDDRAIRKIRADQ